MTGPDIIAVVALVVGAVSGLGGVGLGWWLQERSTERRALSAARGQHARVATQCFLHLNAIREADNVFYEAASQWMAENGRIQRQQLISLAESYLLSLGDLPDDEFAASRKLWHRMVHLTYSDPWRARAQGVPLDFAGPVIEEFIERYPHLGDMVAEQRQLREAEQQYALAPGEDQLKNALREAVSHSESLRERLRQQFAVSPGRGVAAVETIAEPATVIDEAHVPVVLGVVGDVTCGALFSATETLRLARATRDLVNRLPPEARVTTLVELFPRVGSALDLAALLHSYPENGFPPDSYARLEAAIAHRAAELAASPWSLLHAGQLPRIMAAWASVDPSAASDWASERLNRDALNEGLRFLQRCLFEDDETRQLVLDGERLSLLVEREAVEGFLRRFAHTRQCEIAEIGLAMRATPVEAWGR